VDPSCREWRCTVGRLDAAFDGSEAPRTCSVRFRDDELLLAHPSRPRWYAGRCAYAASGRRVMVGPSEVRPRRQTLRGPGVFPHRRRKISRPVQAERRRAREPRCSTSRRTDACVPEHERRWRSDPPAGGAERPAQCGTNLGRERLRLMAHQLLASAAMARVLVAKDDSAMRLLLIGALSLDALRNAMMRRTKRA
jgi:hypothetical protein